VETIEETAMGNEARAYKKSDTGDECCMLSEDVHTPLCILRKAIL